MCIYVRICVHVNAVPEKLEEGVRAPEVGVTDGCELHNMASGNHTWMICQFSKCS